MNRTLLLTYLDMRRSPVTGNEEALRLHQALCDLAPAFYLTLLADPTSEMSHKHEILANLLQRSSAQTIERGQILALLSRLSLADALTVLSSIRTRKINGRRAHTLVLSFLLGHEQFPMLAATRKQYITRLIKHALGERTWSAAQRFLAETSPDGELVLRRELLRFAPEHELARVRETLCFLAGIKGTPAEPVLSKSQAARQDIEQGNGLPAETLLGLRGIYHREFPLKRTLYLAAPRANTVRSDGPLTRLYKEAFQAAENRNDHAIPHTLPAGSPESALAQLGRAVTAFLRQPLLEQPVPTRLIPPAEQAEQLELGLFNAQLREQVTQEVNSLPMVPGRLAIVLDLSASMLSSGERVYHPVALALALVRLLQERVHEVVLHHVGEPTFSLDVLPQPQSATDLATALLDVTMQQPELILLLTDGYENQRQGDTAQVIQGLRQLDLTMPIYQVVPLFTLAENLAQRHLLQYPQNGPKKGESSNWSSSTSQAQEVDTAKPKISSGSAHGAAIPLIPLVHEHGVRELLARVLLVTSEEQLLPEIEAQLAALLLD